LLRSATLQFERAFKEIKKVSSKIKCDKSVKVFVTFSHFQELSDFRFRLGISCLALISVNVNRRL